MPSSPRLSDIRFTLEKQGQGHLLAHWDELDDGRRTRLLQDIERIDFRTLDKLIASHLRAIEPTPLPSVIEPVFVYPVDPGIDLVGKYADSVKRGVSFIRQNKVAVLMLPADPEPIPGRDGPVATLSISPVRKKSSFQLFAEYIQGTNRRYGADLTWYIMTNPINDAVTRSFFNEHNHFGMPPDSTQFVVQGVVPACSPDGKVLLADKHQIALMPDGDGGSLAALRRAGLLQEMADAGVEQISCFPANNPLAKPIDPLFVGLHVLTNAKISSKAVAESDDLEPVVNIGSYMLARSFVEDLTADESSVSLPWHHRIEPVSCVDENGVRVDPTQPNAVRFRRRLSDAIPQAAKNLILQTSRAGEFSPVTHADGPHSLHSARCGLNRRAADWLHRAGFDVPNESSGEPAGQFEISPLLALDGTHLREVMIEIPTITVGKDHYWG